MDNPDPTVERRVDQVIDDLVHNRVTPKRVDAIREAAEASQRETAKPANAAARRDNDLNRAIRRGG